MFKKLSTMLMATVIAPAAMAQTMSLEERVAELEANQSLNIFNFSGYLTTRYDDVKAKQDDPAASKFESHTQHWRLRAGLNANAKISEQLKFYSTMVSSKYMNNWHNDTNGAGVAGIYLDDAAESRDERGSQLYLEKAYADYAFSDLFTFSFGRLPTTDGPPSHLPTGKARMGTYPSLGYNAPFDGFAFSYNQGIGENQSLAARALFTPMTQYGTSDGKLGGQGALADVVINGSKMDSTIPFGGLMLEYGINNTPVANKINVMAFAYQTGKLPIDGTLFSANGTNFGTGAFEFEVGGQIVAVDLNSVAGMNLDLNVTYFQSTVKNSGLITVPGLGNIYGFGASSEGETLRGNTTLVSARYRFTKTYLGAEYLAGGKNVFNYDPATEVVNGFYSTPGTGYHAYVLQKLTPEFAVRVGYMKQEYKSTPFTFGASSDTDRKIDTYYADLRLDF